MIAAGLSAALLALPAHAACVGRSTDQHLVRVQPGPRPLFFAMHWQGRPKAQNAVALRCLARPELRARPIGLRGR